MRIRLSILPCVLGMVTDSLGGLQYHACQARVLCGHCSDQKERATCQPDCGRVSNTLFNLDPANGASHDAYDNNCYNSSWTKPLRGMRQGYL
jgi:hypothetical protein